MTRKAVKALCLMALFLTISLAASARGKVVTITVAVAPQMHCESCEAKIRKAISFERGMRDLEFDIEHNTIKLTFDLDRITLEQIADKLAKAGYEIRIVPEGTDAHDPANTADDCCDHSKTSSCLKL